MALFNYQIFSDGQTVSGTLRAPNYHAAGERLRADGSLILSLKEGTEPQDTAANTIGWSVIFIRKIDTEQALEQLSILLEEGVPIIPALGIVARTSPHLLRKSLLALVDQISTGATFCDAIAAKAPFIGTIYQALIRVGETNGSLPEMLGYSAELMRRKREIRAQVLEAMMYPILIIVATIATGIFMSVYVMPKLLKFIANRSQELPPVTRLLVDINHFIVRFGPLVAIAIVALVVICILLHRSQTFGIYTTPILLRIPLLGKILTAYSNSVWCRTLGMLVASGINITKSLSLTADTMCNSYINAQFTTISTMINEGQPLGISFMATALNKLSPIACSMIVIGENSGSLDRGLLHAAEYNQKQLTRKVTLLGRMIEPAMLIIVGGIVGFVYLAFFLAIQSATMNTH